MTGEVHNNISVNIQKNKYMTKMQHRNKIKIDGTCRPPMVFSVVANIRAWIVGYDRSGRMGRINIQDASKRCVYVGSQTTGGRTRVKAPGIHLVQVLQPNSRETIQLVWFAVKALQMSCRARLDPLEHLTRGTFWRLCARRRVCSQLGTRCIRLVLGASLGCTSAFPI